MNPFNPNYNNNMFKNLYQAIRQSNNPYDTFMALASQNPQMQPIVRAMRSGNSPEYIFKSMCQQRGINPDEFIKSITK